jgi:D-alanyl-D-alanine carboxypeptidase
MNRILASLLAVPLLALGLDAGAAAQIPPEPVPNDDPRARLAAGFMEPLLAGDTAAAAAFLRTNAAPSADVDGLVARLGRVAAEIAASSDVQIAEAVGVPNGPGGVRLSDGLIVLIEPSGEPPRIARLVVGRMRGSPAGVAQGERFASLEALERHLAAAAAGDRFSGVVMAARGDDVLVHRAYGHADREQGLPVRSDTRFNLGSVNKAFTAVAVLRLAQEGRLGLDDPVGTHVRGLSDEIARKVTLRHLLQHRGGVGNYLSDPRFASDPDRFGAVDDLVALVRDRPLDFEPGTDQRYSNTGYVLLGAVVESLTGRAYHDVIREWVLEPAGMTDTGPAGADRVANTAVGYSRGGPGSEGPLARSTFRAPGTPAGGGYSTAEDLLRFLLALAADRLLQPRYTDVLLNRFQEAQVSGPRTGIYGIAGGAPGINAFAEIDLRTREVVVVLANLDPPTATSLGASLVGRLPER